MMESLILFELNKLNNYKLFLLLNFTYFTNKNFILKYLKVI